MNALPGHERRGLRPRIVEFRKQDAGLNWHAKPHAIGSSWRTQRIRQTPPRNRGSGQSMPVAENCRVLTAVAALPPPPLPIRTEPPAPLRRGRLDRHSHRITW